MMSMAPVGGASPVCLPGQPCPPVAVPPPPPPPPPAPPVPPVDCVPGQPCPPPACPPGQVCPPAMAPDSLCLPGRPCPPAQAAPALTAGSAPSALASQAVGILAKVEGVLAGLWKQLLCLIQGTCSSGSTAPGPARPVAGAGAAKMAGAADAIVGLTAANFDATVLSSSKPVMVEFFAPWCGHCQREQPILNATTQQVAGQVTIGQVNCDVEKDLAKRFGITGYPTMLVFENGRITGRRFGDASQADLAAFLKAAGATPG